MLKLYLLILSPLLLVTGIIILFIYRTEVRMERNTIKVEERQSLNLQIESISANMNVVMADIAVLSNYHELKEMLSENSVRARKVLARDFLMFAKHKGVYDQVRFLDEEGMEVVRVNYNKGNPLVVPESELQSKKDRYYFNESIELQGREIYISPFDLNIESGMVEKPLKPMVRFGTPVYDSHGGKRGVVVLNYLGSHILSDLKKTDLHTLGQSILLNSDGYYLMGTKPGDEWGFMFDGKKDRTFIKDHLDAWERLSGDDAGQFYNPDGLYTFARIYPLSEDSSLIRGEKDALQSIADSPVAKPRYWWLISFVTNNSLNVGAANLLKTLLLIYSIIIAILAVASWFVATAMRRKDIAEKAHIESEKSLANAQRIARIGNWDWDVITGRLIWSDEIYRIFGLNIREIEESYDSLISFVHPEDRDFVNNAVDESLHDKKPYSVEHRIIRADGAERIVHEDAEVTFDENGRAMKMSGTVQDITEQKKAENILRNLVEGTSASIGEAFFRRLVKYLSDSLGVRYVLVGKLADFEDERIQTIAVWSGAGYGENFEYALKGTPCENVVGKKLCSYPAGIQTLFPEDKILVDMKAESYIGTPLTGKDGKVLGILAILDDKPIVETSTAESILSVFANRAAVELERREAERKLQESELRYYTFFEQAGDSIVVIDIEDGTLVEFNDMAYESLGYSREEFKGLKIEELEVMESAEEIKKHIDKILNDGADTFETRHKTKDGEELDILVNARLISLGDKNLIQSVWSDITDLKRTEKALRDAKDNLEMRVEERTHDLGERVKELNCLYSIGKIIENKDFTIKDIFKRTVETIPESWQFPDVTCARIVLEDGSAFETRNFKKTVWSQCADITAEGGGIGSIEVCYLEEKAELYEGPFLKEERALLDAIADQLGRVTEHKNSENALIESEERLLTLTKTTPTYIYEIDSKGTILFANRTYEGLTRANVEGTQLTSWYPDDLKGEIKSIVDLTFATREAQKIEYTIPNLKGELHSYVANISPVRIVDHETTLVWTSTDITELKQTEKELENIFNLSPDMVCVCSPDGRFLKVNASCERILGYTTNEIIELGWRNLVHPDDMETTSSAVKKQIKGESVINLTNRFRRKDGTYIILEWQATPVMDGIVYATARDITERKKTEEKLIKSEEKYRGIFDNVQVGIWRTRLSDGKMLECNNCLAHMFAYKDRNDCINNFVTSEHYVDPGTRERWLAEMKGTGVIRSFEARLSRQDGVVIWVQFSGKLYPEKSYMEGVATDITKQKSSEEALRRSEEQFRSVVDKSPVPMAITDKKGTIGNFNKKFIETYGWTIDDVRTPEQWWNAAYPDKAYRGNVRKSWEAAVEKANITGREIDPQEWRLTCKNGELRDIEFRMMPVSEKRNVITLNDITGRKQAEKEIRNAYAKLKEKHTEISALLECTGLVMENRPFDETAEIIFEFCKLMTGASGGCISLKQEERKGKDVCIEFGSCPCIITPELTVSSIGDLREKANAEGTTVFENDLSNIDWVGEDHVELANILFAPLKIGGKVEGLLGLANKPGAFNETDARIISALSDTLAIALQNHYSIDKLEQNRQRLLRAQQIAHMGFLDWNLNTNEMFWSDEVYHLYGVDKTTTPSLETTMQLVHPDDRDFVKENIDKALKDDESYDIDHRNVRPDGTLIWVHAQAEITRDADGNPERMLGSVIDITERKKIEEELEESREKLHGLAMHLQEAREEEREAIARDIHDELGQLLTACKFDIAFINKKLRKDQGYLMERAEEALKLVDGGIQSVKRIATGLRPTLLDNVGVMAAMEWQAEEFQRRTGISCKINFEPWSVLIAKEISTTIFRIFQEALTNVARHAKATEVTATLKGEETNIILVVRDNGKGFSEKDLAENKSFGILGMKERVSPWEGEVSISGKKGEGTILKATIPLV